MCGALGNVAGNVDVWRTTPSRSTTPMGLVRARSATPVAEHRQQHAPPVDAPAEDPPIVQPEPSAVLNQDGSRSGSMTGEKMCGMGRSIAIGEHSFCCLNVLGRGSYSEVWRAQVLTGAHGLREVALKEVRCKTQSELQQAIFEVQVLLALERSAASRSGSLPSDGSASPMSPKGVQLLRVPRCVSYNVDPCGDGWIVRTAMTVVPGDSVEQFIRRQMPELTQIDTAWQHGCSLAAKLILDIGPTLQLLGPIAWHRDVNSHNILVDGASCDSMPDEVFRSASFWLIDFGLAVDSRSWVTSNGRWRTGYIAGDSRYWPASSWIMHLLGPDGFIGQENLCEQYQWRLDIHGLGITALELLCSVASVGHDPPNQSMAESWATLFEAWRNYHNNVWQWWHVVYQVFASGGDIAPVQAKLLQDDIVSKLICLLADLRAALRHCATILQEVVPSNKGSCPEPWAVLGVIADMIDEDCAFKLEDLKPRLPWRRSTRFSTWGKGTPDQKGRNAAMLVAETSKLNGACPAGDGTMTTQALPTGTPGIMSDRVHQLRDLMDGEWAKAGGCTPRSCYAADVPVPMSAHQVVNGICP